MINFIDCSEEEFDSWCKNITIGEACSSYNLLVSNYNLLVSTKNSLMIKYSYEKSGDLSDSIKEEIKKVISDVYSKLFVMENRALKLEKVIDELKLR